jgi:hypothetical protein
MSVFEYLGVILSVIMGLGLTHVLAGLSKTVHHRRTMKPYWVHTVWAFNTLIYIVIIWWGMFWWSNQQDWLFFQFLLLILYAIVLFFLASLLYPWDIPDDFDFETHFFETRPWFFSVLALGWLVDIPETMLKSKDGLRDLPEGYVLFVSTFIALGLIGAIWSNKTYHKIFAVLWGTVAIAYLSATTLREIVT